MSQTNNQQTPSKQAQQPKTQKPQKPTTQQTPTPPLQLAFFSNEGVHSFKLKSPKDISPEFTFSTDKPETIEYSPNGKLLVVIYKEKLCVFDSENSNLKWQKELKNIERTHFSPLSTFFVTLQRYVSQDDENMIVWKADDGTKVCGFSFNSSSSDFWPQLQWNANETLCGMIRNKSLHFFNGKTLEFEKKFAKNCTAFKMSPVNSFATYTKGSKGEMSVVQIYKYPQFKKYICQTAFAPTDDVDMLWNKTSSALLVLASTHVDATGESYYGGNKLYYMKGSKDFSCAVQLEPGPIHDIQWSPKGVEFVVIHGSTPAKATLFNENLEVVFEFGTGPRNRIAWDPFGKLLCIAGIGNYQGNLEFWDRDKLRKIGYGKCDYASYYSWSPDGKLFLTATLTPILNTANGYQLFKYNGVLLTQKKYDKLFKAFWRPAPEKVFKYRPPSPRGLKEGKQNEERIIKEQQAKIYIPPWKKKAGITSGSSDVYKRQQEAPSKPGQPKKYTKPAVVQQQRIPGMPPIPGMAPPEEEKKKKKRKKKKKSTGDKNEGKPSE